MIDLVEKRFILALGPVGPFPHEDPASRAIVQDCLHLQGDQAQMNA
ncbi:hypothetical protein F441_06798 [Phytophthora nicotianae CJ01A1]|uniref:Uncharacterized protein n=3 Tax=Phytophthora nicotianae TaxID=4792 RepID=V9FCV5_PHYNI|nr:hypothetical protein F443_06794 [Phytophthora nicotianae P1569]ETP19034.1 hypothetical protein F441_06798 [Phytophthora nicotianae CJ01A1]ETP46982.1 hypothetical protein F442_06831 [Phytophthora nicotianae P10297]